MTEPPVARVAAVLLVDPDGRVLLQLRDGDAPTSPHKWSMVGGHLEGDEEPPAAARREVLEESGLAVDGPLTPVFDGLHPSGTGHGQTRWWVYAAATTARDTDIVVGEGEAIVFVPAGDVPSLDLAPSAERTLPPFLESAAYRLLTERARTLAQVAAVTADFDDIVAAADAVATDDEHDPEGATIAFERSRVGALGDQARRRLGELDRALEAVAAGRYGACERCGRPIGANRLAARPSATTCIECAAAAG